MSKADFSVTHEDQGENALSTFRKLRAKDSRGRMVLRINPIGIIVSSTTTCNSNGEQNPLNFWAEVQVKDDVEMHLISSFTFGSLISDGRPYRELFPLSSSPNYLSVVAIFVNVLQVTVRSRISLWKMSHFLDDLVQSEFNERHERSKSEWNIHAILSDMLMMMPDLNKYMQKHESKGGIQLLFEFPTSKSGPQLRQLEKLVETRERKVILVTNDFLLAHDSAKDETVVLIPGSPACLFRGGYLDLWPLFENLPPSFAFFMARRLYQFTKVQMQYDCFAKLEKELMIAVGHIHWQLNLFDNVKINLPPMLLSSFVGHSVGYLESLPSTFYGFGIDVLGEIVIFERTESGIAKPVKLLEVDGLDNSVLPFEILPECTNNFDVCIGGFGHFVDFFKNKLMGWTSAAEPVDLAHCSRPAYNLAYVPQFKTFYEKYDEKYSVRDLDKLYETLNNELKYGAHLSRAICRCLTHHIVGKRSEKKEFTLAEAQNLLLNSWASLSDTNLECFPGWKNKESQTTWSLLLREDVLYVVKTKKHLTKHIALGYGPIPMGMALASSERDITNYGKVTNLFDAVVKISGAKHVRGKDFELGCYTPTAKTMQEILGGLVFVCTFLSGRVRAKGVFAAAASRPSIWNPQVVELNLPIPLGIGCSLLSPKSQLVLTPDSDPSLREKLMLMPGSELQVDSSCNYHWPLILGGDQNNENLCIALKNSVLKAGLDTMSR